MSAEGKRQGPLVTVTRSCIGCVFETNEHYAFEDGNSGDSGCIVRCTHPSHAVPRRVGDTTWLTPVWCPFLSQPEDGTP